MLEDFADRLSEVNEPEFFYGGDHPDLMMCPACDSDGWRIGAPEKHTEDCVAVAYKAFKAAAIAEQGDAGKGEEC